MLMLFGSICWTNCILSEIQNHRPKYTFKWIYVFTLERLFISMVKKENTMEIRSDVLRVVLMMKTNTKKKWEKKKQSLYSHKYKQRHTFHIRVQIHSRIVIQSDKKAPKWDFCHCHFIYFCLSFELYSTLSWWNDLACTEN